MRHLTRKLISTAGLTVILLIVLGTGVFASGIVYYGPDGANFSGCVYCRTYNRAMKSACILSDNNDDIYYVYHEDSGYAGSCDMTGGGGSEPGDPGGEIPLSLGVMLWPAITMALAGFIIGMTSARARPAGMKSPPGN